MVTEFFLRRAEGLQSENASLDVIGTREDFSRFCLCGHSPFVGKQKGEPSGILVLDVDAQTFGLWAKLGQISIQLDHCDTIMLERGVDQVER